ncbi:MAG: ParA family protein [Caldilineales bacterium]|nr:ParA family protein [Caldilineales bacterium]
MARIIAVANQKGGVGKTTTVVNTGAVLASQGYRTLLVDLDPQAALTATFGVNPVELPRSVYHLLLAQELDAASVILATVRPHLDLLPANLHLAGAEVELIGQIGREYLLREALTPIKSRYDFILIDCGPSLGLLTINALTAADEVLIPLLPEYLALRGMGILFDTIRRIRERTNPRLTVLGILITLYDSRTLHCREVLEEVRAMFGAKVFETVVRKSIRFAESAAANLPLLDYEPTHPGAAAYRALVEELLHEQK